MPDKPSAAICTLGCRVNQYESEAIACILRNAGLRVTGFERDCDVYIVNTCAVTGEASRKSHQLVRRARKLGGDAPVIVTGCASQLDGESFASEPGVIYVCGSSDKRAAADAALRAIEGERPGQAELKVNTPGAGIEPLTLDRCRRVRAFIKIEDGCNCRCSYCVIPRLRGPVRSRSEEDIISEIRTLASRGSREFILSGIETSAYSGSLAGLISATDRVPGVMRIRLGSLDPSFCNEDFARAVSEIPSFMPHLHLSLQSGCARTLAAMRRRYNPVQAERNITSLRKHIPGLMLSADIICGFPGESEEDFAETRDFLIRNRFLHLHIFPFSPRPGTEAAELPGRLPASVTAARAAELDRISREMKADFFGEAISGGKQLEVLVEGKSGGTFFGHTREFIEARLTGDVSGVRAGDSVSGTAIDYDGDRLIISIQ